MIIPIAVQGALGDFVSDVFTGKTDYFQLLGRNAFANVAHALSLSGPSLAGRLTATAPLISLAVLIVLITSPACWKALRHSPRFVALGCFALVGLGATMPDFDPQHVTEAAPLLIGVGGIAIALSRPGNRPLHSLSPRLRAMTIAVLVIAVGTVVVDAPRPSTGHSDRVVAATFAAFAGTLTSASSEQEVRSDLAALWASTGGNVFIVNARAAFYYLAGGLRNPTPFDFPARTDFGAAGESGVARRLRQAGVRWVCLRSVSARNSSVSPVDLERQLRARMMFVEHLHSCDLYRRIPAGRHHHDTTGGTEDPSSFPTMS
jgi:hypothetical protein